MSGPLCGYSRTLSDIPSTAASRAITCRPGSPSPRSMALTVEGLTPAARASRRMLRPASSRAASTSAAMPRLAFRTTSAAPRSKRVLAGRGRVMFRRYRWALISAFVRIDRTPRIRGSTPRLPRRLQHPDPSSPLDALVVEAALGFDAEASTAPFSTPIPSSPLDDLWSRGGPWRTAEASTAASTPIRPVHWTPCQQTAWWHLGRVIVNNFGRWGGLPSRFESSVELSDACKRMRAPVGHW